ncbi:MAG: hypothetical protein Q7V01_15365 [Vicinamibacterales bacterium]|nr:hypothetical protein [Vicinamibacterales bacterium]
MNPQRLVGGTRESHVATVHGARKYVGECRDQAVREVLVEQELHAGIIVMCCR